MIFARSSLALAALLAAAVSAPGADAFMPAKFAPGKFQNNALVKIAYIGNLAGK